MDHGVAGGQEPGGELNPGLIGAYLAWAGWLLYDSTRAERAPTPTLRFIQEGGQVRVRG